MEIGEDLKSILEYLPVQYQSGKLFWPLKTEELLKQIAKGPDHSKVFSGKLLSAAISGIRSSLSLFKNLAHFASEGYERFFDELISREEAAEWFREVVPALANLLLRFPSLLESHYQNAKYFRRKYKTGLRLLHSQEAGIVFLSQELISALLACAFFCLFPVNNRSANHLPTINFDELFASLCESYSENQQNKVKCIVHYFKRICSCMPTGFVSFERKVLPLPYPEADFWSKSVVPLCSFEVQGLGSIEDQSIDSLEVDFANKYIGGGSLHRGCVQEEIRFMINPELIVGMLFLPSMADNEAIEMVGAERFADYKGQKNFDILQRRKTRIIAIDALCRPGMEQYAPKYLLRETNKAFCGFLDQSKFYQYERLFAENILRNDLSIHEASSTTAETNEGASINLQNSEEKGGWHLYQDCLGIATGNWGCGVFGGDPELKAIIQWLAASQALRPFISYYTFGNNALLNLGQVTQWILSQEWTVGELWTMVGDYSSRRLNRETNLDFFSWLLPLLKS